MILNEKKTTIKEWIDLYILSNKGKKNSISPAEMCWASWEMNPNRIPMANEMIYNILRCVEDKKLLNEYSIEICESSDTNSSFECISVQLMNVSSGSDSMKITIAPHKMEITDRNGTNHHCSGAAETAIKLSKLVNN